MKENQQSKEYKTPQFQFVRTDKSNKVFFAASGTPGAPSVGGPIGSMSSTNGTWLRTRRKSMMKKIMLFVAACVVFAACTKDNDTTTPETGGGTAFEKGQKVTLAVKSVGQTRVASSLDGTTGVVDFKWETGDKIKVTVGTESAEFTLKTGAGESSATFEGTMPGDGTTFDVQYPLTDPDLISQTYVANALPRDKMKMTATGCTIENPFTLKPQYSALRLNLWGSKAVGKIVVIKIDSTDPSFTLDCGTGVATGTTKADSTAFLIIVPAGSYRFSAEIYDNAATPASICTFETTNPQTFTAGKILSMPAKEVKKSLPAGALPGAFSVSATKKVHFSKGNLQATYSTSTSGYTWGFAANQYDYIGGDNEDVPTTHTGNNTIGSQTDGAKVDLFGWVSASSTVLTGDYTKYGISTSITNADYGNVASEALKNDWGTAIDNSGTWFTLAKEEWDYLLGKSTPGRDASLCKAGVTVCGNQYCLVIAPDNFTGTISDSYDASAWSSAQAEGLVCLPAAGTRTGSDVWEAGTGGYYWSATASATQAECSWCIKFFDVYIFPALDDYRRYSALSVRLVCEAE